MPGALQLGFSDQGNACHGLSQRDFTAWVRDFSDEYRRLAGRIPVIATRTDVWDLCTGADTSFADHPLWLDDHDDQPGELPGGWTRPTLWQRALVGNVERNVFFGTGEQLAAWVAAPLR